jgi:spore germination cell wall hydrolase CwlJ-like protein
MTAQAKNRVLAYIVIAMLALVVFVASLKDPATPNSTVVLLPKDVPVLVAVEEPSIDEAEFECLRTNLYHEAGNQGRKGMEAVALVTLNRTKTKHYPSTVCGVVKAWAYNKRGKKVCQFSWYCDGKSDEPTLTAVVKLKGGKKKVVPNLEEVEAWERATEVATAAMEGRIKDFLGRATHYHADYVSPDWSWPVNSKRYKRLTQIGTHLFYRDVALKLKAA